MPNQATPQEKLMLTAVEILRLVPLPTVQARIRHLQKSLEAGPLVHPEMWTHEATEQTRRELDIYYRVEDVVRAIQEHDEYVKANPIPKGE